MKKKIAISIGLVLLIASMPYASAITSVEGPYVGDVLQPTDTVPLDSSFTVLVKTDETVDAAHVNITFPLGLKVGLITIDPGVLFDFSMYQNDTDWVDVIVAEELIPPVAPTLAEIGFTATQKGTYTIDLSSVINGAVDDVAPLTITVIAVPGDANGDGSVDYRDLVAVIEHWGQPDNADVDGSGEVGYSDLTFIVDNWTG